MSAVAKRQKTKAEALLLEADKALNKKSYFFSNKERQAEDACELLSQAANAYKVGGFHDEAAKTYQRMGELYQETLKQPHEAAKAFTQAGSCWKKSNAAEAVPALESAVAIWTDAGRLVQAAKLSKECAELYESEDNVEKAMEWYTQAGDLFGMEDSKSQENTCRAKVAELASAALDPPDFLKAASLYNDLGLACLDSNLLKYNAKAHFLQATLCHLANQDAIAAQQGLDRYEGLDYTFGESREGKFARQLLECVEAYDEEGLGTACFEYDRISKLDPWKTTLLVKIKRSIQQGGGDEEDDDDIDLT